MGLDDKEKALYGIKWQIKGLYLFFQQACDH